MCYSKQIQDFLTLTRKVGDLHKEGSLTIYVIEEAEGGHMPNIQHFLQENGVNILKKHLGPAMAKVSILFAALSDSGYIKLDEGGEMINTEKPWSNELTKMLEDTLETVMAVESNIYVDKSGEVKTRH